MARNISMADGGFLGGCQDLLRDRDAKFSGAFDGILEAIGIKAVKLPPRSPNLNADAERFVRSVKESCLERMIFFGESSLRRAVAEFALDYDTKRNYQGLENKVIRPEFAEFPDTGRVRCRQRLGGLLRYYHRDAE